MIRRLSAVARFCLSIWILTACSLGHSAETAPASPSPTPAESVAQQGTAVSVPPTPLSPTDVGEENTGTTPLPTPAPHQEVPIYGYRVIESYPHDPQAFTQGLVYVDGELYEGTGLNGQSTLRRVDLASGIPEQIVPLADQYFGEGITVFGDRIVQLTWLSRVGFVYDRESFQQLDTFTYDTQGWGLTHDGTHLIMSDGTNLLTYLDPETFAVVHQVPVYAEAEPVNQLNELEYIDGAIYANVWQTDRIARISPETGHVTAWIDLTGLRPSETQSDAGAVLNGIAYDAAGERLLVTGKRWPTLFWIELVPPSQTIKNYLPMLHAEWPDDGRRLTFSKSQQ